MNKKIVKRIWSQFLIQNPQIAYRSLIKANNDFENEYKKTVANKKYACLRNSKECDGEAIDSHTIPKFCLKYMADNHNRVKRRRQNFENPFKKELFDSPIKTTTTFRGFCPFHDVDLFKKLENDRLMNIDNEAIFFLCYRSLAKSY